MPKMDLGVLRTDLKNPRILIDLMNFCVSDKDRVVIDSQR